MGGFVLEDLNGAALRVRDLTTGAPFEVMNIGALTDRGASARSSVGWCLSTRRRDSCSSPDR